METREKLPEIRLPEFTPHDGEGITLLVPDHFQSSYSALNQIAGKCEDRGFDSVVATVPRREVGLKGLLQTKNVISWLIGETKITKDLARKEIDELPVHVQSRIDQNMNNELTFLGFLAALHSEHHILICSSYGMDSSGARKFAKYLEVRRYETFIIYVLWNCGPSEKQYRDRIPEYTKRMWLDG